MIAPRRTNLLWGGVFLGSAVLVLLRILGVFPPAIADLIGRAWPTLLVIFGLSVLLRERLPFGGLLALLLGVGLVGGLAALAYSGRVSELRDENQQTIQQTIPRTLSLLRVQVKMLSTDVELLRTLEATSISGQFSGSTESQLTVQYHEAADNTAELRVEERRPNAIPLLEAVGRGRLQLQLPADVPLDVSFVGTEGVVSLNMDGLAIERLNMDLAQGDAVVRLPQYDPQASGDDATIGTLVVRDGNLTVFVASGIGGRFELNRGGGGERPVFDPNHYNLLDLGDGVLEARQFDAAPIKMRYTITVPRGLITLTSSGE